KAQPSSRAEGVSQGGSPRKGEAFPQSSRQTRLGMLPFKDFDATLGRTIPTSGQSQHARLRSTRTRWRGS
ncbi:MAG: hypothetical protein WB763_16890, partial [Terriglobia bacterium]